MIEVFFYNTKRGFLKGFLIRGHANFAGCGSDIVCAGVSSAVSMCCNGILELTDEKVFVIVKSGVVKLKTNSKEKVVQSFLKALKLQLTELESYYGENITLKSLEVF